MKAELIRREDYQQPDFLIEKTRLRFELNDGFTDVSSELHIKRRQGADDKAALVLDGEQLELQSVVLDGKPLNAGDYQLSEHHLSLPNVPDVFVLQCRNRIYPEKNTALEGLYRSRGMFCTQCEAQGFRKITYYLDRPDVMSEFETIIVAPYGAFDTLLSNGNCISDKEENGQRVVHWHDPFKKPCYLFALVAGNLSHMDDYFITSSGRQVLLQIYTEAKDQDKCQHAMQSLKKAMRWDEQKYGREYDLDRFMIVAVDDFNMGAMENKGLNIFNTSCILANAKTSTDAMFKRVEGVVAHEYFHNWSGNRVTCRDWFQLSLKEGLTVFRDQSFSADMNSAAVKRIEDVSFLRTLQFAEDAGPMAHPVRPDEYLEISNFYTVTVYEKGAEVVRMLANILGPVLYRQACDLYFSRFDGQAVTCDDFVDCMQAVSGKDLSQFRLWYSQAGTPELSVSEHYDKAQQQYHLSFQQQTPKTPGQADKKPLYIPVKMALYGENGALPLQLGQQDLGFETVLAVTKAQQSFVFDSVSEKPSPSLLRGFSAPVKLHMAYSLEQLQRLILLDDDGFGRWDAMQSLYTLLLKKKIDNQACDDEQALLLDCLKSLLSHYHQIDYALLSQLLSLPSEDYLAGFYAKANPQRIIQARKQVQLTIAQELGNLFAACYRSLSDEPSSGSLRSLRNQALAYLMRLDDPRYSEYAQKQFKQADNMTDQFAALKVLVDAPHCQAAAEQALASFYQQFSGQSLVVNMWLQVQATRQSDDSLARIQALLKHPAYDGNNPNKVRSVIGAYSRLNYSGFHQSSGLAYQFLAEQVALLDKSNPQVAARMLAPLSQWQHLVDSQAQLMKQALLRLQNESLSKDTYEVLSKSLASG